MKSTMRCLLAAFQILGAFVFAVSLTQSWETVGAAAGVSGPAEAGKGVRTLLPERPEGCFAQKGPDPWYVPKVLKN
jgi:hypothetical protein